MGDGARVVLLSDWMSPFTQSFASHVRCFCHALDMIRASCGACCTTHYEPFCSLLYDTDGSDRVWHHKRRPKQPVQRSGFLISRPRSLTALRSSSSSSRNPVG